jgi:TRAP-type C4-dicarboxylate transport system permease small subunit
VSAPEHKWERQADATLGIAASVILGCMTLLTFVDVVARYLFNRPIRGGFEVTELLMHAIVAALMFFLTWQAWIKAGKIGGYGDTTDVLRIVVGPFVYFMTAMLALTAMVHVFKIFAPGKASANPGTT